MSNLPSSVATIVIVFFPVIPCNHCSRILFNLSQLFKSLKMWGKKKEQQNTKLTTTGSSSTFQTSTVTTGNNKTTTQVVSVTKQRITSSLETSKVTRQEIKMPSTTTVSPIRNTIWNVPASSKTPALQTDARVFKPTPTEVVGYQSPFNRRLTSYNSLRGPTETNPYNRTYSLSNNFGSPAPTRALPSGLNSSTVSLPASLRTVPIGLQRYDDLEYATKGPKRGKVIIINNIKFLEEKEERKGAEKDEQSFSELMNKMGFDVKAYRNLKKSDMYEKIRKFRLDKTLVASDMSILVIMSHGHNMKTNQMIRGGYTEVLGVDGKGMEIEDILNEFTSENCPQMKGKPKIFIFQCCRGDQSEALHADATPIRKATKTHADMLIAHSTLPGFVSLRDPARGSWYIQSICKVFKENAKDKDIETMLKIVDQDLSNKHPVHVQTSSYESRGFNKRCYLNPVNPL